MAGAPSGEEVLLSTCTCPSCAFASTATIELALTRAFFSACHAFLDAERLEGVGIFRRGNHRVYLPSKGAISIRSRRAGDVCMRLVTLAAGCSSHFCRTSQQAFSADPLARRKPPRREWHAKGALCRCGGAHRAALRRRRRPERAVRALSMTPSRPFFSWQRKCLSCMKWAFAIH